MRIPRALPVVVFVALLALLPFSATASPDDPAGDERAFGAALNGERAARGLAQLAYKDELTAVARRHAAEMARRNQLGHYGDLRTEVSGWDEVGENVGVGPSVDDIHRAFMASSTHRGEILRPSYRDVGIGVVWANGRLWVAEVFRTPSGAPAPAPAPAPPPEPSRQLAERASRSGGRRAVPAVATQPAPPPPPPPAPAPPPAPPVTMPAPPPPPLVPASDVVKEAKLLGRNPSPPLRRIVTSDASVIRNADEGGGRLIPRQLAVFGAAVLLILALGTARLTPDEQR